MKLGETCWDEEDFLEIISDARQRTFGDREETFLDDLENKFGRYDLDMWLSEKQEAWLLSIASRKLGANGRPL